MNGKAEGLSQARLLAACDESLVASGHRLHRHLLPARARSRDPHRRHPGRDAELLPSGKIRAWGISNYASWQIFEMFHALRQERPSPRPVISQVDLQPAHSPARVRVHRIRRQVRGCTPRSTIRSPAGSCPASIAPAPMFSRARASMTTRSTRSATGRRSCSSSWRPTRVWRRSTTWLRSPTRGLAARPGIDSILVGPASIEHLDAAIDGCAQELSPELMKKIDDSAPRVPRHRRHLREVTIALRG